MEAEGVTFAEADKAAYLAATAAVDLVRTIGGEDATGLDLGHTSLS